MKSVLACLAALAVAACACASAATVERSEEGNRITENVPAIPPELNAELQRYANTRSAWLGGWLADGSGLLIGTRFGDTVQVHRVRKAAGAREQLTFYSEPVTSVVANPKRPGFVFGRDVGGSEFWQLYAFDLATRDVRLLTDGTSRNTTPVFSHDGTKLAFSSTARDGKDTDVWVVDLASGERTIVTKEEGTWGATDFSHDGKRLLVQRYVAIDDVRPGVVELSSGKLSMFPVDGGKAAFGAFRFAANDEGVYYTSDEGSEFMTLRYHEPASGKQVLLSAKIPWDVEDFVLSDDGAKLVYWTNEDGISKLHAIDTASGKAIALPSIPPGAIGEAGFDASGTKLAFSLYTATSPSDIHVIDLDAHALARWTESEVGGLDTSAFTTPTLIHFPSRAGKDRKPREIPAFYYAPNGAGPHPVVVWIHGGPEGQSRPVFSAEIQYLVGRLGIAVLQPNVRGSAGYGKRYLALDNGYLREDSVADIGALLDWIATRPELDAKRVGVFGGSYGGYMVLATMTHYNARLRAGVDIVGISNFITFLEHTEEYRRDLRRVEYGDERDPKMHAFLEKISPTTNAKKITIPLFVSSGANDPRVPAGEGRQMAATVRGNGGDVWYLEFKDEGHGFRKKPNVDYFRAATMLFWKRYLLGDE